MTAPQERGNRALLVRVDSDISSPVETTAAVRHFGRPRSSQGTTTIGRRQLARLLIVPATSLLGTSSLARSSTPTPQASAIASTLPIAYATVLALTRRRV
jgi:hypothetical protein